MFPFWDEDDLEEAYFQLGWTAHGGQGLGYGRRDVDELTLDRLQWWLDRINDQRRDEARRIKNAGG